MSARLLSRRPLAEFDTEGKRVLDRDLLVDLGAQIEELHRWEISRSDGGPQLVMFGDAPEHATLVRVPAGFRYDGDSQPVSAIVHLIAGDKERYEVAAAVHDALYRYQAPRDVADRVFWLIARSGSVTTSVGPVRGWFVWAALRVGGWRAYRENGKRLARG